MMAMRVSTPANSMDIGRFVTADSRRLSGRDKKTAPRSLTAEPKFSRGELHLYWNSANFIYLAGSASDTLIMRS
ncbi:MAG: hypothetical protein A3I66_21630 [Burkholderiales bacterium RIFCSPLOWO2_02_FULL_57_36]|nr:MAG: hypothetical protein A3I66_21630 [Burkholderiales bacterium RIFCSPLOWO2_02_FULL_57_36]